MMRAMNESRPEGPWSVPVTVHEVPPTGRRFELKADEATRAAIAKSAGLRELSRLEATFEVTRREPDGLHVGGRVCATVGQICVVTFDPVENEIEEKVDVLFVPGATPATGDAPGRVAVDLASDDIEPLVDDTIDLGALATEFLILGIDPYPRKPAAIFQAPPAEAETEHPFAALAKLKKGQDPHDG
jgi:uncharacterized metal-binding protein YceD (DUF177 family)